MKGFSIFVSLCLCERISSLSSVSSGFDHHSGHRAVGEAVGPHSGPYGLRPSWGPLGGPMRPAGDAQLASKASVSTSNPTTVRLSRLNSTPIR
jgi:hypothetical protein